jgi:hypothetical protein
MDITVGKAVAGFKVKGLMSMPRLAWTDNMLTMNQTIRDCGIPVRTVTGAFWGQCMSCGIEDTLAEGECDAILFVDYDSVFRPATVQALLALLVHGGWDAVAPLQVKRGDGTFMLSLPGSTPDEKCAIPDGFFDEPVQAVDTAHFGCTLVRTSLLRRMPQPWFEELVDEDGGYRKPHQDADMCFWKVLKASGGRLGVATGVSIGHLEVKTAWPSLSTPGGRVYSDPSAFWAGESPDAAHGVLQ